MRSLDLLVQISVSHSLDALNMLQQAVQQHQWPHAERLSLLLPELLGFASAIIRINKTPQINRKR